jgi:hypothetical protein
MILIELVRCELCGKPALLYPSEKQTLDRLPSLTVVCDQCLHRFQSRTVH